jgi:hypothetical protein
MSEYHNDSFCGVCAGPLEISRDAVCEQCCSEDVWWLTVSEIERAMEMGGGDE